MKILLADDSTTSLSLIMVSLQDLGHEVIPATNGHDAVALFKKQRPDLIILDVVMDGMSGFECAKKIRCISTDDWIPIIFLSGSVDDESIAKGIDAGGDDYLTKPFSEVTLAAKIKAMQRISDMRKNLFETTQKLMILSSTDSLTGIYNRFQFNKTIVEKIAQSQRHNRKMAVFFLDLDKFKLINDTLGHWAGDLLLIEVTRRLKSCLRTEDFLARLGGDEFAIIFSDLEYDDSAGPVAQKIIELLSFPYQLQEHTVTSSSSIGIACYPKDGVSHEDLLKNADIAMYYAKNSGRNNYKYFTRDMVSQLPEIAKQQPVITPEFAIEKKNKYQLSVLNCLINKTRICIDIKFVQKTIPLPQLEMMPNGPHYLVGLMNLALKTLPIIDLGALLNLKRTTAYSLDTPILLCSDGTYELGLIIDNVLSLQEVIIDNHEPVAEKNSFIKATTIINSELSLLIDMELLFESDLGIKF